MCTSLLYLRKFFKTLNLHALKTVNTSFILLFFLINSDNALFGQSSAGGSDLTFYGLVGLSAVLLIWALLSIAGNLMKIEAEKQGIDTVRNNFGFLPDLRDIFGKPSPARIPEKNYIKLRKGHDILLEGVAEQILETPEVNRFAVRPGDFHYMSPIPKVEVEIGDDVMAGDVLFYDKKRPEIKYVSPVSGEVVEIRRGEKRSIEAVVILSDKKNQYKEFNPPAIDSADREQIVQFMLESGVWPLLNERPYDIVPDPASVPDHIFISTFDTAPLAPDLSKVVQGNEIAFAKGLEVLSKLTNGKVILGIDGRKGRNVSGAFSGAEGVEKYWFDGPHPAGNVGVQIHHIYPLKPGRKVWTSTVHEVITIGRMFLEGRYDASRWVALTGAELHQTGYVKTYQGASVNDLLKSNVKEGKQRLVSGDVLSGRQLGADDFLSFRDDQITVLKEGDYYELFGWLLPIEPRPSVSGTFPNFLYPEHRFEANTNTHGERRAFVVSGLYESVLPMDIYPMHLMKAIMTNDFEKMEGLGITELSEEDIALCEFVCVSKSPLQSILRKGLDIMKEQS